jgi:hypothetical protein
MVKWRESDCCGTQLVASLDCLYAGMLFPDLCHREGHPEDEYDKANLLSSTVALALGRLGARYHVGYPVLARSVFGMYGQFFFVWIRAVVAIIWYPFRFSPRLHGDDP